MTLILQRLAIRRAPAETTAAQSVTFADRSGDTFLRMSMRATHADALHQAGRLEASRSAFAETETMQAERQPSYPLLYSRWGYQYCDLLLGVAERVAWRRNAGFPPAGSPSVSRGAPGGKLPSETAAETAGPLSDLADIERRAARTLEWRTPYGDLLSIALDHLMLGRVRLVRAVLEFANAHLPSARTALHIALATLRQAVTTFLAP